MPLFGEFEGEGVAPTVVSAEALSGDRVRVTFSEAMTLEAALIDPTNYVITEDMGSDARTVVDVSANGQLEPTYVILTLDGTLTPGTENYEVEVSNVRDLALNDIDTDADTATFDGTVVTGAPNEIDHCELAKARLAWQFRARENFETLVCLIGDRATELEQAFADVKAFRSIETALGETLDRIGTILRWPRHGLLDEEYRIFLRARAKLIASRGKPDELLDILTTLDGGFNEDAITLAEDFPACVVMHCLVPEGEQARGELFGRMLYEAKAAGVKIVLEFEEDGVTLFSWAESDDDPAPPADSAWDEGAGEGGRWAEAVGSDRARRGH